MMDLTLSKDRLFKEIFTEFGITDSQLINAFYAINREDFLPETLWFRAYENISLPIGYGQTISSPSMVVYMTALLSLTGTERVLEIGTGSGYQAAVLSRLARQVYSVEIQQELFEKARSLLHFKMRIVNIRCFLSDGNIGLPEEAPFDRILVTCSAYNEIPDALIQQLAYNGRMIIPVAENNQLQRLLLVDKSENGNITVHKLSEVEFVPFVKGKDKSVFTSMA